MTDKAAGIIGLSIMRGVIARNLAWRGRTVIDFDTGPIRTAEAAEIMFKGYGRAAAAISQLDASRLLCLPSAPMRQN